jgi:hypothetical protein
MEGRDTKVPELALIYCRKDLKKPSITNVFVQFAKRAPKMPKTQMDP